MSINNINNIFSGNIDFEKRALEVFNFQYINNKVYKAYIEALGIDVSTVASTTDIPFLPIRFFKTHKIVTTQFEPEVIFESSGTTETINSKHIVKSAALYEQSFNTCFNKFYGNVKGLCVIGLLPSYLERNNSSLVFMVDKLMKESGHPQSGFYLNDFLALAEVLKQLEGAGQKTLLIGVTFALLDFANIYPMPLQHTIIMETGGMKGRGEEKVRDEVHNILMNAFNVNAIHSEYGMTELLSQAYSKGNGVFNAPPWMKILVRDEDDPLTVNDFVVSKRQRGLINIIDLANIYSCSFIATDDVGILNATGTFEVLGRRDNSDLRGCSLLAV